MTYKVAIDFGTTNSVVAVWNDETELAEVVQLSGLSSPVTPDTMPLIPSLLYVHDAKSSHITMGQAVREQKLDSQQDNRLFRNFKRGIVATPSPAPRIIDGVQWADR